MSRERTTEITDAVVGGFAGPADPGPREPGADDPFRHVRPDLVLEPE
ncbi:hypothetical protein [Streptomyces sp. NPDC058751]